jgi:hypothetical protein
MVVRSLRMFALAVVATCISISLTAHRAEACGKVVSVATHEGTTTLYALSLPAGGARPAAVLVLLAGGGGFVNLDDAGCPRALTGNSLVVMAPILHSLGYATALVDAPSDRQEDEDGLGGFRSDPRHAEDLARIIVDLRGKTGVPVWLAGTSRGTISAVNAASRLKGAALPDGVILTSALMEGGRGKKDWVRDSVFNHDLGAITVPLLLIGHEKDYCLRSPPERMPELLGKISSQRKQLVTMTGGPGWRGGYSLKACVGRAPHGFNGLRREQAEGIARFIKTGHY